MARIWIFLGGVSGFIAVAAGAFGAHGLKGKLAPNLFENFETGAQYQIYHALGMVLAGHVAARGSKAASFAGGAFFFGTLLFSGSLYAFALSGQRWLGAVTPFGGAAFLAGWLALAVGGLKRSD